MELNVQGLRKSFNGRQVLSGISLSIGAGQIVGFVGPNGAGKSTTMKVLLGLVSPDSGDVVIDDASVLRHRVTYLHNVAGYVDSPPFYPILNAQQHMEYVARLRGVEAGRVGEVLTKIGLSTLSRKPVSKFSMGMKQRLGLGMVLLQRPRFLILDEPMNGLDPVALIDFRELIRSLADELEIGVLISSHILGEVERICDRVVFIRQGKVVRETAKADLSEASLRVLTSDNARAAIALSCSSLQIGIEPHEDHLLVSLAHDKVPEIAKILVDQNIDVYELSPARDLLERTYLEEFQQKDMLS